ncbi:S-adenosyl-L-methionine-dependent methyltransferase, partial [Glomus cerebriforme]
MQHMIKRLLSVNGNNINQAKQELKWLTQHVLQKTRKNSFLLKEKNLNDFEKNLLNELINERVEKSKPLQYILGTQPFCDLEIITESPVLIPRWETEEWTSKVISMLVPFLQLRKDKVRTKFEILDVCTGSGCIALSLAHHLPTNSSNIHGIDISSNALSLAKLNYFTFNSKNQLKNSVNFSKLDILNASQNEIDLFVKKSTENGKGFNMILSNPPYVTHKEYETLTDDVKLWEDKIALIADKDGIAFHERIAHLATKNNGLLYIKDNMQNDLPQLIMEIGGSHQVKKVIDYLKNCGFKHLEIWKDAAKKDRCVVAKYSENFPVSYYDRNN